MSLISLRILPKNIFLPQCLGGKAFSCKLTEQKMPTREPNRPRDGPPVAMHSRNPREQNVVFSDTQLDLFAAESGTPPPPRVRVSFTAAWRQRLQPEMEKMIFRALREFPEFDGATLTIGYTKAHLGVATREKMSIRLNPHQLGFNTIGHELTHLLQGRGEIPGGEVQCDIWTLARSPIFLDEPPTYLPLGTKIKSNWPRYALQVRELCIAAIARRPTHHRYILWLKRELRILARSF